MSSLTPTRQHTARQTASTRLQSSGTGRGTRPDNTDAHMHGSGAGPKARCASLRVLVCSHHSNRPDKANQEPFSSGTPPLLRLGRRRGVHLQGNGSARIFAADGRVKTYSQHCEGNLFSAREASDLDVDVPVGEGDDGYLALLGEHLPGFLEAAQPDLVFFQGGVDPHQADRIGRLELSTAGLKKRNALVYRLLSGLQSAPRLVVTLGGGYPRNLEPSSPPFHQVVQSHMDVYRQCAAAHARL
mmetsp:Transcript_16898/g.53429  ORF Transcript_16898/g.53429 Transcript_16898/m.53429 type:complete len:243 (-) Transcript_16898:106-834(-)